MASGVLDHFGLRESQVQGSLNLVGNPEKLRLSLSILTLNWCRDIITCAIFDIWLVVPCSRTVRDASVTNRKGRRRYTHTKNEKHILSVGGFCISRWRLENIINYFLVWPDQVCVCVAWWAGRKKKKKNARCLLLTGWKEIEVGMTSTGRTAPVKYVFPMLCHACVCVGLSKCEIRFSLFSYFC